MPAAVAVLVILAISCRRPTAETQSFPVPVRDRAAAPEALCPPGWRFVNVERDDAGAVVRVVCRRPTP